jgi:hypothetical protein
MIMPGLCLAMASTAMSMPADPPVMDISSQINGLLLEESLLGNPISGNTYSYGSVVSGSGFEIEWNFILNDDAGSGINQGLEVFSSSIQVTNLDMAPSNFRLGASFLVDLLGDSVVYGGSFAGSLTGGASGGLLQGLDGDPLWAGLLSDGELESFYSSPFAFSTDPFESIDIPSMAFGEPIPDMPGPATSMMGTELAFQLSAGSTVSFSNTFVAQIPGPGTLICLSLGLMLPTRKRRE